MLEIGRLILASGGSATAMQIDQVELGSQQAQVPNISAFSLFQENTYAANTAETANIVAGGCGGEPKL